MGDRDDIALGIVGGTMAYGALIGAGVTILILGIAALIYWVIL